jgi:hypothetical protein
MSSLPRVGNVVYVSKARYSVAFPLRGTRSHTVQFRIELCTLQPFLGQVDLC